MKVATEDCTACTDGWNGPTLEDRCWECEGDTVVPMRGEPGGDDDPDTFPPLIKDPRSFGERLADFAMGKEQQP